MNIKKPVSMNRPVEMIAAHRLTAVSRGKPQEAQKEK
jgi:hypothetical protein